jgi:hypothetical protein
MERYAATASLGRCGKMTAFQGISKSKKMSQMPKKS